MNIFVKLLLSVKWNGHLILYNKPRKVPLLDEWSLKVCFIVDLTVHRFFCAYVLSVIDLIIIHKVSHYRRLFSILIITRNPYRFSRPDRMTLTLTTTLILAWLCLYVEISHYYFFPHLTNYCSEVGESLVKRGCYYIKQGPILS